MTPEEAKKILALYRPGSADQDDPDFAEALDMADPGRPRGGRPSQIDPELSQWFREHCAAYLSVRGKFLDVQTPPAFKDQILAEYKSHMTPGLSRRVLFAGVAGLLTIAACLTLFFVRRAQHEFAVVRQQIVGKALGAYSLDVQTNDMAVIDAYLAGHYAPVGSTLPAKLKTAEPVGCAVIDCHGLPVTMLCFKSGEPLDVGRVANLWLFVANENDVVHAPQSESRTIAQEEIMATATWSQNGKLYVLGVIGDQNALQKYF
jgi:hypothetical protein